MTYNTNIYTLSLPRHTMYSKFRKLFLAKIKATVGMLMPWMNQQNGTETAPLLSTTLPIYFLPSTIMIIHYHFLLTQTLLHDE